MRIPIIMIFLILCIFYPTSHANHVTNYNVSWSDISPDQRPAARFHHAMVYDSDADKVLLFGGNVNGLIEGITWSYDPETNTWTNRNTSNSPPGLNYHAMAYDATNKKTILFGGYTGSPSTLLGETFAYDYATNNWTKMDPEIQPSPRRSPNMVYDLENQRMVLFGGRAQVPGAIVSVDDTWTYDFLTNSWTEINTTVAPDPRSVPAMAYDSNQKLVLLYGGTDGYHTGYTNDTWIFNTSIDDWMEVNTPSFPSRGEMDMVFDASTNHFVLYGGTDGDYIYDELWTYTHNNNTWEHIIDYIDGPGPWITEQSMVFDTLRNQTIFYGGASPDGITDEVDWMWSLKFDSLVIPTSTTTSSLSSSDITSSETSDTTTSVTTSSTNALMTTSEQTNFNFTGMVFTVITILVKREKDSNRDNLG